MQLLIWITLFIIGPATFAQQCCKEYCYGKDIDKLQTRQYATKTAYQLVKGKDFGKQYTVADCKPVKMWMLSRHGTRLPTEKVIEQLYELEVLRDEIVKNYRERRSMPDRGALCNEDLLSIQTWKPSSNLTKEFANHLTIQGWNDLKFLAKTYQRLFPEILDKQYNSNAFQFKYTKSQRTEASFKAFAEGLFGNNAHERINIPSLASDEMLLAPQGTCSLWNQQYKLVDAPGSELYKFDNSEIMKSTILNISMRLGFKFPLEKTQIQLIWDICRYEQAWHVDRSSSWCAAFTPDEVSVLEYKEDLKYYYDSGHGSELNSRISCLPVQDMLKHLETNSDPHAVVYFSHSAALQLFLVALGIAKDRDPLKSSNYFNMNKREWKTSLISPFASNFAAIKFDCPNDAKDTDKVLFILNQTPVQLDWCKVGLCDWSDIVAHYDRFMGADCSDMYCENNSGTRLPIPFMLMFFLLGSVSLIFTLLTN